MFTTAFITLADSAPIPQPKAGLQEILAMALLGALAGWFVIVLVLQKARAKAASKGRAGEFHHSVADQHVPRFGGLALVVAFLACVACFGLWHGWSLLRQSETLSLVIAGVAMFGVGFWDDLKALGARKKLALQILVSLLAYGLGLQVTVLKNPFTGEILNLTVLGPVITVIWLVAMTNLINLIDGIDGLAGGISMMLMCLLAFVGVHGNPFHLAIAVGMAGALLAFLRFNFPPARIYLGDGGAYFLGFLIGSMTIVNSQKGTVLAALVAPIIALGLPIIDTTIAIVRRGLKGLPLFRADRKHIHHKLMQQGLSRTSTVLLLYAVSVVFLLMAFALFWSEQRYVPIVFGLVFLVFLFLLQGRSIGFDWLVVGRSIGNSREMRRHTQYVMALSYWLEMEADRAETVDALWEDFAFITRKVGFTRTKVVLSAGHRTWEAEDHVRELAGAEHVFEFNPGERMLLTLQTTSAKLDEQLADHLSELVAEAWLKAVMRWTQEGKRRIQFDPARPAESVTAAASSPA
jgi:UDP-GlcNAc:undecaprenyl-phosphate GlcNAc-1-phosphate transferase